MSYRVLVEKVDDYEDVHQFIQKALNSFKLRFGLNFEQEELIVKPNFLTYSDPAKGCITHPDVVKAVVNNLKDLDPIIAEGSWRRGGADKCFSAFDLHQHAQCINLNKEELTRTRVNGRVLKEIEVAQTALKAINNPFISLPKLKIHGIAGTTLGIKNNMGFIKKPAVYMHFSIHQKLIDLLKIFQPALTIIDGIVGGNVSELYTKPIEHGVMIASDEVVAADVVGSYLMGFNPADIGYLKIAFEELALTWDDIKIESSHNIDDLRKDYTLPFWSRALGSMRIV
ncbi:MAG: DUF362 domain-containing protein [Archaeoglobaceae archaeon]